MNREPSHRWSIDSAVVTVTYDRQFRLNTLNSEGIAWLTQTFRTLARNDDVRAVIVTGAGPKAFIGGADLNELASLDVESARAFITRLHELLKMIRTLAVPVIARINGYCLGAGMELAAACDLRIASDNAVFGMPEVRVGLPSVIEAALLPRLVGWGRSNYLVLTGETIDAATVHDWGFLESLVSATALDAETGRIAGAIATAGPLAVRAQKALVLDWERLSLEEAIAAGIPALASAYASDEPRRLMQAFFDRKRSR